MSVPSCDEPAPQSHGVFTHRALNPEMVGKADLNVFQYIQSIPDKDVNPKIDGTLIL